MPSRITQVCGLAVVFQHPARFTGNAQTAILQRGLFLVAMLFAATLPQMATLKWLLKSPATFKELLTGRLYASGALLVVFASLDALLFIPIVWITTNVTDEQAFIILLSWIIGEFLVFVAVATYYDIASVCAFTRLRKRRWLEAYCALALFFIGEEGVLAMVAFSILAVAYREPRFLIGVLVSALLILPFVFYAKLRLPKLRNLVQREYVSY